MVQKGVFGHPVRDGNVGARAARGGKFRAGQACPYRTARQRRAADRKLAGGLIFRGTLLDFQVKRSSSSCSFGLRGWNRKYSAPSAVTTSPHTRTTFKRAGCAAEGVSSAGGGVSVSVCSVLEDRRGESRRRRGRIRTRPPALRNNRRKNRRKRCRKRRR